MHSYVCNVCGHENMHSEHEFSREGAGCPNCVAYVRIRAIAALVAYEMTGERTPLFQYDSRLPYKGVGMSDLDSLADGLANSFHYTNTYYHKAPFLDITDPLPEEEGAYDFIVSTDVFEHILAPVQKAFDGAYKLLKPGGKMIFSVPYSLEDETQEHFPSLNDFQVLRTETGDWRVKNVNKEGDVEYFDDLTFHGGPGGTTLELRLFCQKAIYQHFEKAGFSSVRLANEDVPEYGIYWKDRFSLPMVATK